MGSQFKAFWKAIRRYFRAYGGWKAVIGSPLFLLSITLAALTYPSWADDSWDGLALSIIPSLLGFSLGTYAILFSILTTRMKRALKQVKNKNQTPYLDEVNATFFHFIFVQVIALLWAVTFKATTLYDLTSDFLGASPIVSGVFGVAYFLGNAIGFLLLIYSVSLTVGAALAIFRLASIVDPHPDK